MPTRWLRDLSGLPGEASHPEMVLKATQQSLPTQALHKAGDSEGLWQASCLVLHLQAHG